MTYEYRFDRVDIRRLPRANEQRIVATAADGWRRVQILVEQPAAVAGEYALVFERRRKRGGGRRRVSAELLLRLCYGANILILAPVVVALHLSGTAAVFGRGVPESPGLRLLVAALWGAILVCSLIGLAWPRPMAGILVLQVIYKSAWLATFVLPAWRTGAPVPWGPATTFAPIVLLWPVVIIRALG